MLTLLLIFLFNQLLVFGVVSSLIRQFTQDNNQKARKMFWAFAILSVSVQTGLFFANKQPNFYEHLNLTRNFQDSDLKREFKKLLIKFHPDKNQENNAADIFNNIQNMKNVISSEEFKHVYDSYGEFDFSFLETKNEGKFDTKYEIFVQNLSFSTYTEMLIFYAISLIILVVLTYEPHMRRSRKGFILVVALFGGMDYMYIEGLYNFKTSDPLDYLFPTMAIFERIILNRLLLSVISSLIRLYFFVIDKQSLGYINQKSLQIFELQREFDEAQNSNQTELTQLKEMAGKIQEQSDEFNQLITNTINLRKEQEGQWSSKIESMIQQLFAMVMGLFSLYVFYSNFMVEKEPKGRKLVDI